MMTNYDFKFSQISVAKAMKLITNLLLNSKQTASNPQHKPTVKPPPLIDEEDQPGSETVPIFDDESSITLFENPTLNKPLLVKVSPIIDGKAQASFTDSQFQIETTIQDDLNTSLNCSSFSFIQFPELEEFQPETG